MTPDQKKIYEDRLAALTARRDELVALRKAREATDKEERKELTGLREEANGLAKLLKVRSPFAGKGRPAGEASASGKKK